MPRPFRAECRVPTARHSRCAAACCDRYCLLDALAAPQRCTSCPPASHSTTTLTHTHTTADIRDSAQTIHKRLGETEGGEVRRYLGQHMGPGLPARGRELQSGAARGRGHVASSRAGASGECGPHCTDLLPSVPRPRPSPSLASARRRSARTPRMRDAPHTRRFRSPNEHNREQ